MEFPKTLPREQDPKARVEKRPYVAPQVVRYGTLVEMTKSSLSGVYSDGGRRTNVPPVS